MDLQSSRYFRSVVFLCIRIWDVVQNPTVSLYGNVSKLRSNNCFGLTSSNIHSS